MPGTLSKLGRAQRPHLTYPLMYLGVSDGGSEKECTLKRKKERKAARSIWMEGQTKGDAERKEEERLHVV